MGRGGEKMGREWMEGERKERRANRQTMVCESGSGGKIGHHLVGRLAAILPFLPPTSEPSRGRKLARVIRSWVLQAKTTAGSGE